MKDITQFILEFKSRRTKGFDYLGIKKAIQGCKPSFFGKNVFLDILWTPEIYFNYSNGRAYSKPRNNGEDKNYDGISLSESSVMFIDFYAEKKLFKENTIVGYITWILPSKINDDDTNCDELEKFLKEKTNDVIKDGEHRQERIKFESYEELEKYLKEIEKIINVHNTKCEKNEPTYLYFDKTEASLNAQFKKKQYEILTCEDEIVKLTKQLEDVENAAKASDIDLTALMDSIKEQIENFKRKKEDISKS